MEKERIGIIAQLLISMKEAAEKLDIAYKKKDAEMLASVKREMLQFQAEIKKLV